MVQIGRRGTVRRLFENFKKFSKITEFNFQNSGPSFFASVSPVYCKKNLDSIPTKLAEEIHFEVAPMTIPAISLLQQHDARRDILIEPAAQRGGMQRSKLGGISNWGCNRAVKTNRLVRLCVTLVSPGKTAEPIEMPFALRTRVGPWNYLLDGLQIPHGNGQF